MTGLTVTDEMLKAYWRATQAADLDTMADAHRAGLQAVLDLIADTAPSPDPRTDLAGYLGLDADDIEECRIDAIRYPKLLTGKVGARLIEQDQARADEPDDGLHAMLDIDALGGAKHLRETMCVAQGAVLREGHAGAQLHADRIASIIDVCDQHRPLGPDGKHGTRRCTPTCGCIDKREPEPDDGLIPRNPAATLEEVFAERDAWVELARHYAQGADYWWARFDDLRHNLGLRAFTAPDEDETVMLTSLDSRIADAVEGDPNPAPDDGLIPVTVRLTVEEVSGEGESWDTAVDKLCDACAAIDLPAPLPPWKSPLADLPDLTEEQCCDAVRIAGEGPDSPVMWAQVGRALIAAGWTPEEEA